MCNACTKNLRSDFTFGFSVAQRSESSPITSVVGSSILSETVLEAIWADYSYPLLYTESGAPGAPVSAHKDVYRGLLG